MSEAKRSPTELGRSLRASLVFLMAAPAGWLLARIVGESLVEVFPDFLLPFFLPASTVLAGAASIAVRRSQRKIWWGALVCGALLLIVLEVFFVEWVLIGGVEGTEIPVITSWSENHPGWTAETCVEQGTINPKNLDSCWNHRWAVKLALTLSYLTTLAGLGGVVGLLRPPPGEEPRARPQAPFDFHLRLDRSEGGLYHAVARDSEGREVSEPVSLAEVLGLAEHFPLRFAGPLRGGGAGAEGGEAGTSSPKRFGGALFEAVFTDDLRGVLRATLKEAEAAEMPLRVWLNLQEVPELADLPWEYLFDRQGEGFLALSHDTPLLRCLESHEALEPLGVRPPLRVLVMISTPTDYGALDAEAEWERIRQAAAPLVAAGQLELERLPDGTYAGLRQRLRRPADLQRMEEGSIHVFHFIGHGGFSEQDQQGVLVFEDAEGRGAPAGVEALAKALGAHHTLRLAILNSCNGARASHQDAFAGAAQTLLRGVRAVVAMQSEVTDRTARRFAEVLYQALADGSPIDEAVSEVRNLLSGEGNPEWGTPVLYLRATDGRLFQLESEDQDA